MERFVIRLPWGCNDPDVLLSRRTTYVLQVVVVIAGLFFAPRSVAAQHLPAPHRAPPELSSSTPASLVALPPPNGSGAFLLEALGGAAGSLIGMGVVGFLERCDVEDLGCLLHKIGLGGALGVAGAVLGTTLVARQTGSNRSVAGAALGGLAGTGIGLGVHYLLNNNSDRNIGDRIVLPIFVISQGTFAALGSRLLGRPGR
jgi:hypothetical protein